MTDELTLTWEDRGIDCSPEVWRVSIKKEFKGRTVPYVAWFATERAALGWARATGREFTITKYTRWEAP